MLLVLSQNSCIMTTQKMSNTLSSGPLSPEEFQRQLTDFVRQQFQSGRTGPAPEPAGSGPSQETGETKKDPFEFKYKPKDVTGYLDRFVIKQNEAKKVLSVALCDHYNHVRLALGGKAFPNYAKQNIILLGPT